MDIWDFEGQGAIIFEDRVVVVPGEGDCHFEFLRSLGIDDT